MMMFVVMMLVMMMLVMMMFVMMMNVFHIFAFLLSTVQRYGVVLATRLQTAFFGVSAP